MALWLNFLWLEYVPPNIPHLIQTNNALLWLMHSNVVWSNKSLFAGHRWDITWRNIVSTCKANQNASAFSFVLSANRWIMWFTDQVNYFKELGTSLITRYVKMKWKHAVHISLWLLNFSYGKAPVFIKLSLEGIKCTRYSLTTYFSMHIT